MYVGGGLDPNVYVARNYADKPTRMRALITFFGSVPAAAANIRANLKTPMPLSFVNYGVAGFEGFARLLSRRCRARRSPTSRIRRCRQFAEASAKAGAAMAELATWLEGQRATATQDFALGAERFSRMLATTEGVDTPLDRARGGGARRSEAQPGRR